jgi:hypothetical protein
MKTALMLLSALTLMAIRASAETTNLNESITIERPLADVVRAMHTYYFSTNYHGFSHAVHSTNEVKGVSYTLGLWDCVFSASVGMLDGEIVATRVLANSTRLNLIARCPEDSKAAESFKRAVTNTLARIAKIAEAKP